MVREIDRFEVQRLLGKGAQLVDVLPKKQYDQQHIAGAINVPLDELSTKATGRLDIARPVITYCCDSLCDMSGRAAARLLTLGFNEVYNYQPSKVDWLGNGLPAEGSDVDRPRLGDVTRADVPTCRPEETVADVRERIDDWDVCLVVDQDHVLLGLLRAEALGMEPDRKVASLMQEGPTTYRPDLFVEQAADMLSASPEPRVIVSNADGVMVGIADPEEVQRMAKEMASNAAKEVARELARGRAS